MEQENRDYNPRDEDRDYSDLSDNGRSAIERAQSQWGSAKVINGDYDPSKLEEAENSNTSNNTNNVSEAEKSGNTNGWNTSVSGGTHKSRNDIKNSKKIFGKLKGKGPLLTIGGGLGGSAIILSIFLSPSLIFFHVLSLFSDSIANFQLPVVNSSYTKTMKNKIASSSAVGCNTLPKVACRLKGVSDFQIERFRNAGIQIETGGSIIPGKSSISEMKITTSDGISHTITPTSLSTDLKNPEIRTKLNEVYNPTAKQFSGSIWTTIKKKFGVDKKGAETKTSDGKNTSVEELKNDMVEKSNESSDGISTKSTETTDEGDIETENSKIEADSSGVTDYEIAKTKLQNAVDGIASKTNLVNMACMPGMIINTINASSKTIKSAQTVAFALSFASQVGQIKAGDGTPELSTMLGNSMTNLTTDVTSENAVAKSATDSPSLKWAMFTDSSSSKSSKAYAVGGNKKKWNNILTESTSNLSTSGATGTACSFTSGMVGDTLDFAAAIVSGGSTKIIWEVAKATFSNIVIPGLLDMFGSAAIRLLVGEVISDDISGEDFGSALGTGMTEYSKESCVARGCTYMSESAATAYYSDQKIALAEQADYDRQIYSPFDMTNKNTFLGSIVSSFTPYYSTVAQPLSVLSSIGSVTQNSISSLLPGASAVSSAQYAESLKVCDDAYLEGVGAVAAPTCTPIVGVSSAALDMEIDDLVLDLVSGGYINGDIDSNNIEDYAGGVTNGKDFEQYLKYCVNRTSPLGMKQDETKGIYELGKDIVIGNGLPSVSELFGVDGATGWASGTSCVDTGNGESVDDTGRSIPIAKFAAFIAAFNTDLDMSSDTDEDGTTSNSSSSINQDGKDLIDEYVSAVGTGSVKGVTASFEQCAAFSQWYRAKISGDYQDHYNDNGNVFVDNTIADYTGWEKSSEPVAGSIFSIGSNTGSAWPTGEFGHTGIVLAVDGDKITIAHNNISTSAGSSYFSNANGLSGIGIWEVSLSEEIKPYNWTFAVYKGATS